jgi:ribonuclease HI
MSKMNSKYYVVWRGVNPGIYQSWEECKKQVEGVQSALYRSFSSKTEAIAAFNSNPFDHLNKEKKNKGYKTVHAGSSPILDSISVDAACSGNPGILEYRGVMTKTGEEIFRRGPFPEGTTNIGEFLAIVTGLAWLKQRGSSLPLYSDSYNGLLWVRQKNVKTKLERNQGNKELFNIIEKALDWLYDNSYDNQLLKWETSKWGEIPADFGRK